MVTSSPREFLDALHASVRRSGRAKWLAGRVDGDSIVVLFRQDSIRGCDVVSGSVQGTRLQFESFAQEILGPGSHRLEDVLSEATLEIIEPHEPGQRLQVPWADGLCADPVAVLWRPDAVDAAAAPH